MSSFSHNRDDPRTVLGKDFRSHKGVTTDVHTFQSLGPYDCTFHLTRRAKKRHDGIFLECGEQEIPLS